MSVSVLPVGLRLKAAEPTDRTPILELLRIANLAADDVEVVQGRFIVAHAPLGGVLGCVALERMGTELLLRSLAVHPDQRAAGIGALLVEAALLEAWARRARKVVLVTETAAPLFAQMGFREVERDTIGGPMLKHPQFTGACPASATVMAIEV